MVGDLDCDRHCAGVCVWNIRPHARIFLRCELLRLCHALLRRTSSGLGRYLMSSYCQAELSLSSSITTTMSVCSGGLVLTTYAVISPVKSGTPVATITNILDCDGKPIPGPLPVLTWHTFMAGQRILIPNGQGSSLPGQKYDVNVAFFLVPPNSFPILAGVSSGTFGVGGPELIPGVNWAVVRYTGVDIGNYPGVYAFVRHATTSACAAGMWPMYGASNWNFAQPITYYATDQQLFWLPCPGASTPPSGGPQTPLTVYAGLPVYQASDVNWYPYVPGVTTGYLVASPSDTEHTFVSGILEMVPGFEARPDLSNSLGIVFLGPNSPLSQTLMPRSSLGSPLSLAPAMSHPHPSLAWGGHKTHHRGSLL